MKVNMVNHLRHKMKISFKKKGLSDIVAILLLILLVIIATVVIYFFVRSLIDKGIDSSEKCSQKNLDKIQFNYDNTCYYEIGNLLFFSIDVKDINVDKLKFFMEGGGNSKTYFLEDDRNTCLSDGDCGNVLINYDRCWTGTKWNFLKDKNFYLILKKNEGHTYVVESNWLPIQDTKPNSIKIYPVIENEECGVSDLYEDIPNCLEGDFPTHEPKSPLC